MAAVSSLTKLIRQRAQNVTYNSTNVQAQLDSLPIWSLADPRWGADATGATDSTARIQACFNYVGSRGGGTVYIPATPGDGAAANNQGYKVSGSIEVPAFVNIQGEGFSSCLRASTTLPGGLLRLKAHGSVGGRFIRDIRLSGNNGGTGIGTDLEATDTETKHIYGWMLEDVFIESFEWGLQLQGMWHSTLLNVTTSACRVGLHLWGQNVSINILGSHFRRDSRDRKDTFGIVIQPRVYAWSPDQTRGSRSETIVMGGEFMCIGQEYGIYVHDVLDLQISNMDLDYIFLIAIAILNVNGGCNISDGWIAADSTGTTQFSGIVFANPLDVQQMKTVRGLHMNLANNNPLANNQGVAIASQKVGKVAIRDCTFSGGWAGVDIYQNTAGVIIDGNIFAGNTLSLRSSGMVTITNNRLDNVTETGKAAVNTYMGNNNGKFTDGIVQVSMPASANSGSLQLPNPVAGATYVAELMGNNSAQTSDFAWVEGSVVRVSRATPVAVVLNAYVRVTML
ncbi:tail spike protein [Shigella phage Buco]|uniref:Tailspike protein n=1 Tax=Shigella phage Buco TaxID=2530183 RepID=A0A482JJQ0_9CAUD|nr:tail spike protein [Shigella phage Buco]QBP32952.1 tailspike protein [Shigella phage Buco]